MKVLHIISSSGMYGAEAVILNLMRMLQHGPDGAALGVFLNSSTPNSQLHDAALNANLESHQIPCAGQVDRATIRAIRDLAAQTGADVIHAHGFKADIYCYLALRGSHRALVSTCHTWYDNDRLVTWYGKLDRFMLRNFTRVVAVSEEVRQRLLRAGVRDQRIRKIRNGIDLRPFERPSLSAEQPANELVVGLVGRLAWEKGVDVFVEAAARVSAEFKNARFVVIGDGPDRDTLDRLIDDLGLRERVTLAGRRDDMPAAYASLDIMVSASRQEGLPMAILEGMASSLPLVATAVGEVPTMVLDESTGLLVPPENADKLAAAILDLLRDPAKRARLGAAAHQLIEDQYSAERMAAEYLQVYEDAISAAKQEHAK